MSDLPRSTPVEQDVDPAAVLAFVDAVDADPDVELHSLMVLRHGHVVAEGWWAPHTPERTRLLYSLSKSFTSTALAFALDEGLVGLDDTAVSHFPELADEVTDPGTRSITLRHLASMASGHDREMWPEALERDHEDPVRGFLLTPPDHAPGSVFAYSQPCTYTLAAILQRRAGMRLSEYLAPRLLEPLGIGQVSWQSWPGDRELGFSGLFARTEDVAKLGQLYLQRGRWGERQLVPEWYVEEATSVRVANPNQENVDWQQGYGYQFWMARHGFRGDGAFGQFCLVLPEQDAVVAMTAGTEAMQAVLDHVWERLLPGLGARGLAEEVVAEVAAKTQAELDQRLRDLALPPAGGSSLAQDEEDWFAAAFVVSAVSEDPRASALTSVGVARSDRGLEVTVHDPGNALTFVADFGQWAVSEPRDVHGDRVPVAASAGRRDDQDLEIQVIFLETPHRMDIVCSLPERTAQATWRVAPLDGGRLERLHRPARRTEGGKIS